MDRSRTFGIVAHVDAGKTTLTERILFDAGVQRWVGEVDDGTAAMDWMAAERSRGISITAAATRVPWAGHVLQVVDTPGHVDFVAEVQRCLFVLDGVVVVVDAVRGVESQTEAVWRLADERALPRLLFVNKLDREGADFARACGDVAERLGAEVLPLVVPLFDARGGFAGLADALTGAVQWFDGTPSEAERGDVGARLRAAHDRVLECVADLDDGVLAAVVEGRAVPVDRLRVAIRREVLAGKLVPGLAGAARWNRGVDWLLDAVVAWLPRPGEVPVGPWSVPSAGVLEAPAAAFVFKIQHVDGVWNFVRVVRGRLVAGMEVARVGADVLPFQVERLCHVHADRTIDVSAAGPGEIAVLVGECGLRTGDVVVAPGHPVLIPAPRFAEPVLAMTFEPDRNEDLGRLASVLRDVATDDPTLRVDRQRDRVVVRGMGELHLEVVADLVRERAGLVVRTSAPVVDRREVPARGALGGAEVRAMVEGNERMARCDVAVALGPKDRPASVVVGAGASGQTEALAVAAAEIERQLAHGREGPVFGATIEVARVHWSGGVEPVDPLVEQAAARALAEGLASAGSRVHEPWVAIDVTAPEDARHPVLADLSARGAELDSVAAGRLGLRVLGRARLASMLGYITRLRSMTRGLGRALLRPSGYRPQDEASSENVGEQA